VSEDHQTGTDLSSVHLPEDAQRRLATMSTAGPHQLFTSNLSVNEFLLVREAGFRPVGLVLGTSVYHVGIQVGRWSKNMELDRLTAAMYHARELAMSRMQAETEALRAEGIVGVQLLSLPHRWGGHTTEFFAIGTAVRPLRDDHVITKPTPVLPLTDTPR
jgi:uncharacterized protein YbjQ (UPF0145 family)